MIQCDVIPLRALAPIFRSRVYPCVLVGTSADVLALLQKMNSLHEERFNQLEKIVQQGQWRAAQERALLLARSMQPSVV